MRLLLMQGPVALPPTAPPLPDPIIFSPHTQDMILVSLVIVAGVLRTMDLGLVIAAGLLVRLLYPSGMDTVDWHEYALAIMLAHAGAAIYFLAERAIGKMRQHARHRTRSVMFRQSVSTHDVGEPFIRRTCVAVLRSLFPQYCRVALLLRIEWIPDRRFQRFVVSW